MDSWLEFEGKSVDAALKKAGKELRLPQEKLKHEILFAGKSGIFGLVGAKNARIRVVDPSSSGGDNSGFQNDKELIDSLMEETFSDKPAQEKKRAPSRPAPRSAPRSTPRSTPRSAPSPAPSQSAASVKTEDLASDFDENGLVVGQEVLQRIVDLITVDAQISLTRQKNRVLFNVEGGNPAVMIGKRGQTLKAMQHIVEKVVRKSTGSKIGVQVDVEKYVEKRETSLKELALRLAEKAKQTGKPSTISRIDSSERKVIHDVLRKDKGVKTRSVGSGDLRNVVIHPGKKSQGRPSAPQSETAADTVDVEKTAEQE